MKRAMFALIGAMLFVGLWVALITFAAWGFDPALWTGSERFWFGMIAIFLAAFGAIVVGGLTCDS